MMKYGLWEKQTLPQLSSLQFSPQKDNQGLVIVTKCKYSEDSHHWINLTWVEGGSSLLGVF